MVQLKWNPPERPPKIFELVELLIWSSISNQELTLQGWWTGSRWDGHKLREQHSVIAWRGECGFYIPIPPKKEKPPPPPPKPPKKKAPKKNMEKEKLNDWHKKLLKAAGVKKAKGKKKTKRPKQLRLRRSKNPEDLNGS